MIRRARRSPAATLMAARTGSASTKRLECVRNQLLALLSAVPRPTGMPCLACGLFVQRGPSLADWSAELLHCRCMTQSRSTCGSSGTASRATTPSWYACHSTQSLDVDREASPLAAQNEDNWDVGDLHYQIYNSLYGFDVHRRPGTDDTGDYTFKWQPSAGLWYFLSVSYLSTEAPNGPFIRLSVDDQWVEDSNTNGDPIRGPVRAKPPQVTTIRGVSGVLS